MTAPRLVILYGIGGLSDVGRHVLQAALDKPNVSCTVLTKHPELLEESNWKCGCTEPHDVSSFPKDRFSVVKVDSWDTETISDHFRGASAVIQCLGNRQVMVGENDAAKGSEAVIASMKKHGIERAVAVSSVGIGEDWPPLEFFWGGKILAFLFSVPFLGGKAYRDLSGMENNYRASDLDYLLVRPVGIGEDIQPVGKWFIQKQKFKDVLGFNMAKLDVARFCVEEALQPTKHKEAVVVGAEPPSSGNN